MNKKTNKLFAITFMTIILLSMILFTTVYAARSLNPVPPQKFTTTEYPIMYGVVVLFIVILIVSIVLAIWGIKSKKKYKIVIGCIVALLSALIIFFLPVKKNKL